LARRTAFIACNHGVQVGMGAMPPAGRAYCTQQTRGPTRGMTLRAMQLTKAIVGGAPPPGRPPLGQRRPGPRHCVQHATVRFRTLGPSDPKRPSAGPMATDEMRRFRPFAGLRRSCCDSTHRGHGPEISIRRFGRARCGHFGDILQRDNLHDTLSVLIEFPSEYRREVFQGQANFNLHQPELMLTVI
jgi:hypothetical protein